MNHGSYENPMCPTDCVQANEKTVKVSPASNCQENDTLTVFVIDKLSLLSR